MHPGLEPGSFLAHGTGSELCAHELRLASDGLRSAALWRRVISLLLVQHSTGTLDQMPAAQSRKGGRKNVQPLRGSEHLRERNCSLCPSPVGTDFRRSLMPIPSFHDENVKIRGLRFSSELTHHQGDLTAMVSGMVRDMLQQMDQFDLGLANRNHSF